MGGYLERKQSVTTFTMTQLEALAASIEQGTGNEQARESSRNVPSHRPPLAHKTVRQRIYDYAIRRGGAVTRAEIATALKLRKSTWLNGVIERMVTDGYLTREHDYWKNGMVMYRYRAN